MSLGLRSGIGPSATIFTKSLLHGEKCRCMTSSSALRQAWPSAHVCGSRLHSCLFCQRMAPARPTAAACIRKILWHSRQQHQFTQQTPARCCFSCTYREQLAEPIIPVFSRLQPLQPSLREILRCVETQCSIPSCGLLSSHDDISISDYLPADTAFVTQLRWGSPARRLQCSRHLSKLQLRVEQVDGIKSAVSLKAYCNMKACCKCLLAQQISINAGRCTCQLPNVPQLRNYT